MGASGDDAAGTAVWAPPFSFAEFMRSHYRKLHAQVERDRRVLEETGRRLGLPVEKIVEVRRRLADA